MDNDSVLKNDSEWGKLSYGEDKRIKMDNGIEPIKDEKILDIMKRVKLAEVAGRDN